IVTRLRWGSAVRNLPVLASAGIQKAVEDDADLGLGTLAIPDEEEPVSVGRDVVDAPHDPERGKGNPE
ncbi:MAG: hypothetical protein ACRD1Z_07320, partial [Vicinamibacteria bacterium]